MDLPTMITSLFSGLASGVLEPAVQGLYSLAPYFFVIAIIAALAVLLFSGGRPGPAIATLVIVLVIGYFLPHVPDLIQSLMSYNGVSADAGGMDGAVDAARSGLEGTLSSSE